VGHHEIEGGRDGDFAVDGLELADGDASEVGLALGEFVVLNLGDVVASFDRPIKLVTT